MIGRTKSAPKISLLIADVDGSLVTKEKVLTPHAQAAVKALHGAGIAFAITSGRPPRGMAMLIEPLALRTPIAGFNGGIFIKPDMTIIEEHLIGPDAAERAVKLILDHRMDVWVYSGNDWFVRDPDAPHVAREQWTVKFPPAIVDDFGAALDRAVKIVGGAKRTYRMRWTPRFQRLARNLTISTSPIRRPIRGRWRRRCPNYYQYR